VGGGAFVRGFLVVQDGASLRGILNNSFLQTKNKMYSYMGVSTNRGTSKWMVYNGKPY